MRVGSLFSGIGAPEYAWRNLGWDFRWCAEIDKFPSAVLAHRFPGTPNLGDVTKVNWDAVEPVDLIVFGSPCQSFSVAGKRLGLDDPRGNLALFALGVARQLRPKWLVFENVPGLLSSDGGGDFGAFLGLMGECGYHGAWRVMDAQFAGVPQRRRRVFVVGHLGDWRRAAAVLFERASLQGHPPPRREAGQGAPASVIKGAAIGREPHNKPQFGEVLTDGSCYTLNCTEQHAVSVKSMCRHCARFFARFRCNAPGECDCPRCQGYCECGTGEAVARCDTARQTRLDGESETFITHSLRADGFDASEDGTGRGTPLVAHAFDARQSDVIQYGDKTGPLDTDGHSCAIAFSSKDHGADAGDLAPTLRAMGHDGSHANAGGQVAIAFDTTQITSPQNRNNPKAGDPCHPLAAHAHAPAIAAAAVRRLTPRECERLQGFPEINNYATILVCSSDRLKAAAFAEIQSLRSHLSASHVGASASARHAGTADRSSAINLLGHERPVALNVLIDLERGAVRILRAERLLWSASDAEPKSSSPLRMPLADFARLAALLTRAWEPAMSAGAGALPASSGFSSRLVSGSEFVPVSGPEIAALVGDAERFTSAASRFTKSTTSGAGSNSPNSDESRGILSCCVAAAISGFIPEPIRSADLFALSIETIGGWTQVPYRGKPAADGPRYKAIGNSMAIPVVRWLGERIQSVEALITHGEAHAA